jgi:hypothetical protein
MISLHLNDSSDKRMRFRQDASIDILPLSLILPFVFIYILTREQFCPWDMQAPDCFYYKLLLLIAQSWALVSLL